MRGSLFHAEGGTRPAVSANFAHRGWAVRNRGDNYEATKGGYVVTRRHLADLLRRLDELNRKWDALVAEFEREVAQ